LHDLDEREHGTLCACSPLLTVRHIVSDDVDLISQPRDLREESSRSFGILLVPTQHITRIAANVAPNIVYPAIQFAPHRRRSKDIIYQCYAQDTDRDRRHSVRHRREHILRRIDVNERNDCDRVTGQHGGVGLIAAEATKTQMHIQQTKAPSIPIRSPENRPAITTDMVASMSVAATLLTALASAAPRAGCARIATVTAAHDAPPSCSQKAMYSATTAASHILKACAHM
jgi:hypothetical protein